MPLDFPNDPAVGDIFADAGARWQWDGFKWTSLMTSGGPFLPLAGGALTGTLILAADPVVALHAATKQYVDGHAGISGYLPLTGGELSGNIIITNDNAVGSDPGVSAGLTLSANTGGSNYIQGASPGLGLPWWQVSLGSSPSEGGEGGGPPADFQIARFNDAGALIDYPLTISRATGVVTFGPVPPSTMRRFGEAPAVTATAGVGSLQGHPVNGTVIQGSGSTTDFLLNNKNGTAVMSVPTGTTNANLNGQLQIPNNKGVNIVDPLGHPGANIYVDTTGLFRVQGNGPAGGPSDLITNQLNNLNSTLNMMRWVRVQPQGAFTTTMTPSFASVSALSGTISAPGFANQFIINPDTVAGGVTGVGILHHCGGASMTGGRTGMGQVLYFDATSGNGPDSTAHPLYYCGFSAAIMVNANDSGTPGAPSAAFFAENPQAKITVSGVYARCLIVSEFDIGCVAGSSVDQFAGIKITQFGDHAVQGVTQDAGIVFGMQTGGPATPPGLRMLISAGSSTGWWPCDPVNGVILGTQAPGIAGGPPVAAAYGIKLDAVTFSQAAFQSAGFKVDGSGRVAPTGATFGTVQVASYSDLSKHIALYSTTAGISYTSAGVGYSVGGGATHVFLVAGTAVATISAAGINNTALGTNVPSTATVTTLTAGNTRINGIVGFNNTSPIAKPTVSGAKASNAALASLITALANYGLITDTTTA